MSKLSFYLGKTRGCFLLTIFSCQKNKINFCEITRSFINIEVNVWFHLIAPDVSSFQVCVNKDLILPWFNREHLEFSA